MYTECFIVKDSSPSPGEHGNDLECPCLIKQGTGPAGVLSGHRLKINKKQALICTCTQQALSEECVTKPVWGVQKRP